MRNLLPLLLLFSSCTGIIDTEMPRVEVHAFATVYATRDAVNVIATEGLRATTHPGKIYAFGTYAFQVELYQKIHIVN
ncbi:MAG TPA: hypothetical protein VM187_11855 [Niastella sp.]|nr:hypothetical protein [Niastella sp.]